jgi:hypothetical protein
VQCPSSGGGPRRCRRNLPRCSRVAVNASSVRLGCRGFPRTAVPCSLCSFCSRDLSPLSLNRQASARRRPVRAGACSLVEMDLRSRAEGGADVVRTNQAPAKLRTCPVPLVARLLVPRYCESAVHDRALSRHSLSSLRFRSHKPFMYRSRRRRSSFSSVSMSYICHFDAPAIHQVIGHAPWPARSKRRMLRISRGYCSRQLNARLLQSSVSQSAHLQPWYFRKAPIVARGPWSIGNRSSTIRSATFRPCTTLKVNRPYIYFSVVAHLHECHTHTERVSFGRDQIPRPRPIEVLGDAILLQ